MKSREVQRYISVEPKSGFFRYLRRVPIEVSHVDTRGQIKRSLKTRNLEEAIQRAKIIHEALEAYWGAVSAEADSTSAEAKLARAMKVASAFGFQYMPVRELMKDTDELVDRIITIVGETKTPIVVEAALGIVETPALKMSGLWTLYEQHNRAGLTGMSPNQIKKHQVSRERAIRYFIESNGDKNLDAITRDDTLGFRDWWTTKIATEKLRAYSANRSFSDIAGMLTVVDTALRTEFRKPWENIRIKETNATKLQRRLPFPVEWVQDMILADGALDDLNEDARLIVYVMADTGMRLGEVCNLRRQDIHLDDAVPHVEVADREDRRQKTDHSIRRIPLVGVALWAMKQRPNGFPRYQDKGDTASATINKALSAADLRPTDRHTVYSLRHTFQDRIENAGASDRMQADLMGHEFGRPTYGDGAEMKRRQAFLDSIKFRWPVTVD